MRGAFLPLRGEAHFEGGYANAGGTTLVSSGEWKSCTYAAAIGIAKEKKSAAKTVKTAAIAGRRRRRTNLGGRAGSR